MKNKTLIFIFLVLTSTSIANAGVTLPTAADTGLSDLTIQAVLTNFTEWLLTIFLILSVLAFVITGLMYIFSMGDGRSQSLENAKQYFKYAITAVAITGGSYIVINSIDLFLKGTL